MHFHLPKPLHGWRAFVGEVGIIVLGVGIALAAEQILETAHWRQVVDGEGNALEQEVVDNGTTLRVRFFMQPCIDRRLAELALVFRRHNAGQPLGLVAPIGRPTIFGGSKSTLEMATSDQSLSHMPLARKQTIFTTYSTYDVFAPTAAEERSGWRVLQGLDHPATLDAEDWRDLRKAFDAVVDNNVTMKANLGTDGNGPWLAPFNVFAKPDVKAIAEALRALPYVQELCRPALKAQSSQ
jgi:hypothetical protein